MAELLVELLSEEIPARMQAGAMADLRSLIGGALKSVSLPFHSIDSYVTPRRLVVVVNGLVDIQADWREVRRGPRVDAPKKAIEGFLKSVGLEREQIEERETDKGRFLFAVVERKGRSTAELLTEVLPRAVAALPWPKSMRWSSTTFRYVRPLHNVLAVFDRAPLRAHLQLGRGMSFEVNNKTCGHRFLAPEPFAVKDFADYKAKLKKAKVILDPAERCRVIEREAAKQAKAEGLKVRPDPELVAENAGLVEWPVVLMGRIDPEFMGLHGDVLTTVMRHHLKHFALTDKDGNLAPYFLMVAGTRTKDRGRQIVEGNERVLRARLADAKFFWDQDRNRTLKSRVSELDGVVFHAKLGSLGDKVRRIEALAAEIAAHVPGADGNAVREAGRLCKADLTTEMVGEFPELQGVMGCYYALADGEKPEVADAIAEHYAPLGPNDACPTAPVSVAVALADKIDSLVGFFAIGEKPTGSKDPYALRRAALGAIRLIVENKIRVALRRLFAFTANRIITQSYYRAKSHTMEEISELKKKGVQHDFVEELEMKFGGSVKAVSLEDGFAGFPGYDEYFDELARDVLDFFADRLKVHLKEKGVRHDLIGAAFATGDEDDLVRLLAKVGALEKFLSTEDGEHLLIAYKRAANIVRIEEKRDGIKDWIAYYGGPIADVFEQDEEKDLHVSLTAAATASSVMLEKEDFSGAMSQLAQLRGPVDAFFDEVTVNCDEPKLRENRLKLLARIRATMDQVADFSKIEG